MNILIIGAGGREHAIGKKIKQSPKVNKVYCAPGNPGMTIDGTEQVDIHELDFWSNSICGDNRRVEKFCKRVDGKIWHPYS